VIHPATLFIGRMDDGLSSDIQLDIHHWDACTGWRRVLNWRPRKAIKQRSHQRDRRAERRRLRQPASS
jgi:hypothetical protein